MGADLEVRVQHAEFVAPESGVRIVEPTTLTLSQRRVSIIGANGSGKSTLARMINGLVTPTSGSVSVNELDTIKDGAKVRRQVGFLFTDPSSQLIMPTTIEDVTLSLRRSIKDRKERHKAAMQVLADIGLDDKADVSINSLSGGQRQLLALAGVLAVTPTVIVADEPTTLLDMHWRAHVGALLRSLPVQLIEVTHDLEAAARADRTLVVDQGSVVYDGAPSAAVAHYREMMLARAEGSSAS
ncbi:MAG: energy-coupling factor ABC transporter ATP-binding protein [Demequina sp.]